MEREVVRLMRLEIRNIKNVAYGKIDLSTGAYRGNKKGSILGIYGQNGSGKTVVVDAMVLLKCLLSGKGCQMLLNNISDMVQREHRWSIISM